MESDFNFELKLDTSGSAFENAEEIELARIFRAVGNKILLGSTEGSCIDANGNTVGFFKLVPRTDEEY